MQPIRASCAAWFGRLLIKGLSMTLMESGTRLIGSDNALEGIKVQIVVHFGKVVILIVRSCDVSKQRA